MKVELFPNQLFMLCNKKETQKNEVFCDILLTSGHKANIKIVEPVAIDKKRTKLEGTTKERLDETIVEIIDSKYNLKRVDLSDEKLDEIEDIIADMKLPRKDKRKKQEELEKKAEDEIKEVWKKEDIANFFSSDIVYQANGLFLDNDKFNSGLLQIPGDIRFKARNLHLVKNDNPILNISILKSDTKQVLTLDEIKSLDNETIKIMTDINYLTNIKNYKNIFEINEYLLNKLSDSKNTTNKFDIHNLIYLFVDKNVIKNLNLKENDYKEYNDLLYKNIIKPLREIIKKYKNSGDIINKTDKKSLLDLYNRFYEVFICYNDKFKLYKENQELLEKIKKEFNSKLPPFVKVFVSVFIQPDKRKEFINYIVKDWKNSEESFFNIIKNKDKVDYFSKIDTMPLKNIVGQFKFNKSYDENHNLVLHKIFQYPAAKDVKTPTPRMMGYSFMEGTFIPNIIPASSGKNRGFTIDVKIIQNLRK